MALRYDSFTPAEDPNDFAYETVSYDLSLLFLAIVVALILAFLLWAAYAKGKSDTRKALRHQRLRSANNIYEAIKRAIDKVVVSTSGETYDAAKYLLSVIDERLGKTLNICGDLKKQIDPIKKAVEGKTEVKKGKDGEAGTILVPVNLNFGGTTPGTPPVGIVSPAQVYTGKDSGHLHYTEHWAAIRVSVDQLEGYWRNKAGVIKMITEAQEELLYSEDLKPEIDLFGVSFDGAPRPRRRRMPFSLPPEGGGAGHNAPAPQPAQYAPGPTAAASEPPTPPEPPAPKKRRRPGLA